MRITFICNFIYFCHWDVFLALFIPQTFWEEIRFVSFCVCSILPLICLVRIESEVKKRTTGIPFEQYFLRYILKYQTTCSNKVFKEIYGPRQRYPFKMRPTMFDSLIMDSTCVHQCYLLTYTVYRPENNFHFHSQFSKYLALDSILNQFLENNLLEQLECYYFLLV